ncbi:MAG: HlyD family efflux transporter periplasmic adaptor subunit [Saprospiraceae bacterium]|nr:HlyD family efflux transporter periplasmic adaptor subunit [Saprospiraceae bacterium]
MEEREYVELRSEEVQEILGTPPGWLVSWGTMIVLLCFAALLGVAAMISYPDVIEAKVVITTATPPVEVFARTDGHITRLLVHDRDDVQAGKVLAVLQSTARYADIQHLDSATLRWHAQIDNLNSIALLDNLEIGDVQADYSTFVQDVERYRFGQGDKSSSVRKSISSFNSQIEKLENSIAVDQNSKRRLKDQLITAREFLMRQKRLLNDGAIAELDFERERQRVNDLERQYDALEDNIIRKQNEIISLRKNKNDVSFDEKEDAASSAGRLRQSLNALRASLDKWKQSYLLIAPIDGKVSLNAAFFSENQYVKQGEQVLAVVPPNTGKIIGRLTLPTAGSGKVRPSQRVILKLDSYPYYEFGTIRGIVVSKSLVPKDNAYSIIVSLPDGLTTSYQRDIPFEQQLPGKAEIVTDDKQFLQRIYEQVFAARH